MWCFMLPLIRSGQVCNLPMPLVRLRQPQASKSRINDRKVRAAGATINLWNVSSFLGHPAPPAGWWTESYESNETTFPYWINRLADVYAERKGLSQHQAALIRQGVEFRTRLPAGRPQNIVRRTWRKR